MPKRLALIFGASFLLTLQAFALTPPFGEKMLKEEADLIVQGEVGSDVKNEGVTESNNCSDTIKYVAPLKVVKACKGKAAKGAVLPVVIFHKNYQPGCVGDQDASLKAGDQGLYYLRKGDEGAWRPVHWDGVKLKESNGAWPQCP